MVPTDPENPPEELHVAHPAAAPQHPVDLRPQTGVPSPSARLEIMTLGRIESLEADKLQLDQRLETCRDLLRQIERDNATLREKNAVLRERLDDQGAWDVLATLLVGFGGLLSGAASYLPKIGMTAGLIGFGLFAAGLIMQTNRLYRRFRVSQA